MAAALKLPEQDALLAATLLAAWARPGRTSNAVSTKRRCFPNMFDLLDSTGRDRAARAHFSETASRFHSARAAR